MTLFFDTAICVFLQVQNVSNLASPLSPPAIDPEGTTAVDDLHRQNLLRKQTDCLIGCLKKLFQLRVLHPKASN